MSQTVLICLFLIVFKVNLIGGLTIPSALLKFDADIGSDNEHITVLGSIDAIENKNPYMFFKNILDHIFVNNETTIDHSQKELIVKKERVTKRKRIHSVVIISECKNGYDYINGECRKEYV